MSESARSARPKPRPCIERMQPYRPPMSGRRGKLRLDFNENTLGPSPKVLAKLREVTTGDILSSYPEYESARGPVGEYFGVEADQVVFSDGTDEAIHVMLQTFVEPGAGVLMPWPTFPMYRFYT